MPSVDDYVLQILGMSEALLDGIGVIGHIVYDAHRPKHWPTSACFLAYYGFPSGKAGWHDFCQLLIERPVKTRRSKTDRLCRVCRIHTALCKGRCRGCYTYFSRHGTERPFDLYKRVLGRHRRQAPRWCSNCGHPHVYANLRCYACYKYRWRNGVERPRHKWDNEAGCIVCGIPLATLPVQSNGRRYSASGMCYPCYQYRSRTGEDRPRHLWGIGPHGWCECGYPAVVTVEGMPVCERHRE